jgi:uncharacterized protein (DUF433 family)
MPRPNNSLRPPAVVVSDPEILGGWPVVKGTRVPAETILKYIAAGCSKREIFEDYPSLPVDGIEAVIRWDEERKRAAE